MQHNVPMMQDADKAARGVDFRCVCFGYHREPDIAPGSIDRDDLRLRPQRKFHPEGLDPDTGIDRGDIRPHQAPDREIADPADVGGAADGLAAQMQAPGRKGVAEQFAGDLGGDHDRDQHHRGEPEIAGRFQRDERHRQRAADHGRR